MMWTSHHYYSEAIHCYHHLLNIYLVVEILEFNLDFLKDKIHAGDVIDELYGEALRGNKMSVVSFV